MRLMMILWLSLVIYSGYTNALVMDMDVDAEKLMKGLLEANIEIPTSGSELVVWFPKWIPGIHGPRGPVENIGGLKFSTSSGENLDWKRDWQEPFRFICQVPKGVDKVKVFLRYICNQPSVNSRGVDSYGNLLLGVINWNTCVVYPEGIENDKIQVRLRVKFPEQWQFASSLESRQKQGQWQEFAETTLENLVDSPMICGKFFRRIDVSAPDFPPAYLNLVSQSQAALEISQQIIDTYKNLIIEAKHLFGRAPYSKYEFLVVMSDETPSLGLEHLSSSLNGFGTQALFDSWSVKGWVGNLLPHEFVHAWCGKYRRPKGMYTKDFHSNKNTNLLWIYEGLTTYLGEVLAVRCGFLSKDEYLHRFTEKFNWLKQQTGREWRSLEDTALSAHLLRDRSKYWPSLRRRQDYYNEGLLLWLEIDALLRRKTEGKSSLDDFCQKFLGQHSSQMIFPYELEDVGEALYSIVPFNWVEFMKQRVENPLPELPKDVIGLCGYEIKYVANPSSYLTQLQNQSQYIDMLDSLGMNVDAKGQVTKIIPGMLAEQAGFRYSSVIFGVNGKKFSRKYMMDALKDSITKKKIEFLVVENDSYSNVVVDYNEGPKYLQLVLKDQDILGNIVAARKAK